MKYGKLINGTLKRASNTVTWQNHKVNNPSEEKLKELGYLPIIYTDSPSDAPEGFHYESSWKQTESNITQVWTLVEDAVYSEAETLEDLAEAIERGLAT